VTDRPHVLFVDDEPRILGALRRMLRTHRDRWDMSFAEGGAAALATMQSRPCDVIVSDYRMPGMDGAQLLETVRREYPGTARVILSGQTNEDNVLKIMVLAHEFLTKPSTPDEVAATVERLLGTRVPPSGAGQRQDVALVEALPSPPQTLMDLVAALDAEDASTESVGTVVERDPAATAKILHLVNSSAYTTGRKVSDVGQAVALLGLDTVRGLVLTHDLIRTFDIGGGMPAEWIDGLTLHSVETSRLARMLGADTDWQSHAFTGGLLHEVGQLVLASSRPADFHRVLAAWRDGGAEPDAAPLHVHEAAVFDVSHIDAGARLIGLWGLPAVIIEAIAGHATTEPPDAAVDPASAVALAHLAVEADLGAVCGPCGDPGAVLDVDRLDERSRAAVSRWRRERLRRSA
jgi:HD-like signal output (HDOD) protein/ActR/RegA family two-component response regulator